MNERLRDILERIEKRCVCGCEDGLLSYTLDNILRTLVCAECGADFPEKATDNSALHKWLKNYDVKY
jgi:hypothetical protein